MTEAVGIQQRAQVSSLLLLLMNVCRPECKNVCVRIGCLKHRIDILETYLKGDH
jgi:hypothetical protein